MQLGEIVNVAIPDQGEDGKCPFSHDPPETKEKNELGGIGTTLGENMRDGKGICHESRKGGAHSGGSKEDDPRKRKGKSKLVSVIIRVSNQPVRLTDESDPLPYPLTCAAHHLIPAQESLKGHAILKYMCKKGEQQDFRNGKKEAKAAVPGSKVWGNVAYNVNGSHNGVWLPGNYAVGGGTGGVQVWNEKKNRQNAVANKNWIDALDLGPDDWDSGDDDDEEEAKDALKRALGRAKKPRYMLSGTNYQIKPGNPKWAYVKAAMDASGGQFHDRHEKYSGEVKDYLTKIAAAYKNMLTEAESNCADCKKAAKHPDASASEVGPPFGIVGRLKTAAEFFKGYLTSTRGVLGTKKKRGKKIVSAENIFTSGWVQAWYADEKK